MATVIMTNEQIIAKYSGFWEFFERRVNLDKLVELSNFFNDMSKAMPHVTSKRKCGRVTLKVSPHVVLRLAQSAMSMEEVKSITLASLEYLLEGTKKRYLVKTVMNNREEVYSDKSFMVVKNWIQEKRQVDFISCGLRGVRESMGDKSKALGITKQQFQDMSNKEKRELYVKFYS